MENQTITPWIELCTFRTVYTQYSIGVQNLFQVNASSKSKFIGIPHKFRDYFLPFFAGVVVTFGWALGAAAADFWAPQAGL